MPKIIDQIYTKHPFTHMMTSLQHVDARWILDKEKLVMAPDFPWFAIRVYHCQCGCGYWKVEIIKKDIGYIKVIMSANYKTPLEAHVKFGKVLKEVQDNKYHGCTSGEGEMLD